MKNVNQQKLVKFLMVFVGISGCFSVLFGAWLAHAGQSLALNAQSNLHTALQYQLLHTLALLTSLVWLKEKLNAKLLSAACIAFFIGIMCFSGTIYIKTLLINVLPNIVIVGKLTPFGGISLAFAWILLSIEGIKNL